MAAIRTNAELAKAVQAGATEIELDAAEPISLNGVKRPLRLVGRVAPAVLPLYYSPIVNLYGCSEIEVALQIVGLPNGSGGFNGKGLIIRDCDGVAVRRADIGQVNQGVTPINSANVVIERSDLHDIQVDAIIFQQMRAFSIVENLFARFFGAAGNHCDAIQGHSNNGATDDCDGVTIARNLLDLTPADAAQGIFLSDAHFGGHRNVTIEDNLLVGSLKNMIFVNGCKGAVVRSNRIMALIGAPYVPSIVTGGVAAAIEANEAPGYDVGVPNAPVPTGNRKTDAVAQDVIEAARAGWLAQYRPGAVPAPAPVPSPAPSPAPPPTPVDPDLAAKWQKAWDEQHAITLGSRRAETALLAMAAKLGVPTG